MGVSGCIREATYSIIVARMAVPDYFTLFVSLLRNNHLTRTSEVDRLPPNTNAHYLKKLTTLIALLILITINVMLDKTL